MKRLLWLLVVLMTGCSQSPVFTPDSIRILRDEFGTPHIYADTRYALYFGYGFAVAQDRLFQMEMAKRSTQGTVAEVLGAEYVDYDVNARTLYSPQSIKKQLAGLKPEEQAVFEGFAAGMNAWIERIRANDAQLPKQFSDQGFSPSVWSAFDVVMIFVGTMNNRYGDFNTELQNASILKTLIAQHGESQGMALFNLLNPRFTDDAPTTIPTEDWSVPAYDSLANLSAGPKLPGFSTAPGQIISGFSNCYVIGKQKTVGGKAILVNGPQFGWFVPSYVYSVGLHSPEIDVAGNTPFAYPMIMFGHNKTISWGSTWGASDIVDIYEETIDPENPDQYLYRGKGRSFEQRSETIRVKDANPVTVTLYRSVHGPVIRMDRESGVAYAKKRAWDGRELETLLAWLYATWSKDFEEWKSHAELSAINVNMYYADVEGNIGYFHGGHFPQRVAGHDNRFPVSGDGSMDWQERQSIDQANPHVLNPSSGFLANWNNKPGHGVMNPDFFYYSWSSADRVDYLNDYLANKKRLTPDQAWGILDTSSYADVYVAYFLPFINQVAENTEDAALIEAAATLNAWNRESRDRDLDGFYDEQATGLFRGFVGNLIQRTLKDDLGDAFVYFQGSGYPTEDDPTGAGTNLSASVKAIVEALEGHQGYDVFNGEDPLTVVADALKEAQLSQADLLPTAKRPFYHKNFLGIPQASPEEARLAPIEQNRGTENNMIVMRPGRIEGWEVAPPGQDGFVDPDGNVSKNYDNQFELYNTFGRKRLWFYPNDVAANARSEQVLVKEGDSYKLTEQ